MFDCLQDQTARVGQTVEPCSTLALLPGFRPRDVLFVEFAADFIRLAPPLVATNLADDFSNALSRFVVGFGPTFPTLRGSGRNLCGWRGTHARILDLGQF